MLAARPLRRSSGASATLAIRVSAANLGLCERSGVVGIGKSSQMHPLFLRHVRCAVSFAVALAAALPPIHRLAAAPAATATKSGYAVGPNRCGQAPFPKVRIGMRPGYCAGLVASKDDGLVFPRAIVQVPDTGL